MEQVHCFPVSGLTAGAPGFSLPFAAQADFPRGHPATFSSQIEVSATVSSRPVLPSAYAAVVSQGVDVRMRVAAP